ncbi:GA module-containing protein [Staphylococcus aureus]|uniref:GA module-containing protein n=1 Tax=Staphylococcus aureus TaxID=1280 RepID=UPI0011D20BB0|nr:GA module-containing protein [Staphylococcus aureus]
MLKGKLNETKAKTTTTKSINNLTSIKNAQREALKTKIESARTGARVKQVSTTASKRKTAMSK